MKIFISWSGEKSRRIAVGLKAFLQDVNHRLIAWFSDQDIRAGERWGIEVSSKLEESQFGIICATQDSIKSPWVLFEAGALGKIVSGSKVCPYLIDLNLNQLEGPLAQFQAKEANEAQTWEMMKSINYSAKEDSLPEERLKRYFDTFWPTLRDTISQVNHELRPLPYEIRLNLVESLPKLMWQSSELSSLAVTIDLSAWLINWNQAAIYCWEEVIQVAYEEKKLEIIIKSHARIVFSRPCC